MLIFILDAALVHVILGYGYPCVAQSMVKLLPRTTDVSLGSTVHRGGTEMLI